MRDLSPMPDGVDPDERTVFHFFRSTGNGMQFDVNKPHSDSDPHGIPDRSA